MSTQQQRLSFPMRETMPYFVCSLRQVDEWKRLQAKRSRVLAQAEYDVHAKYVKSPFARSLQIEDLLRFLEDTELDVNFMVQLPSIEKCLDQWWRLYGKDKRGIDQDTVRTTTFHMSLSAKLRQVYYDLAYVLVHAKTESIQKNSVSIILRASWTRWSPKDPPLDQAEFYRLLFILAHLMTESSRLGDYVVFFQETLAKITRIYQSKAKRTELRRRKPRVRRKSSLIEIMGGRAGVVRMKLSPSRNQPRVASEEESTTAAAAAAAAASGSGAHVVNVTVQRVLPLAASTRHLHGDGAGDANAEQEKDDDDVDDDVADRFVEILDRGAIGRTQHVITDPLLLDARFQAKWRRPGSAGATASTDALLRGLNPELQQYVPPLHIARLQATASGSLPKAAMQQQGARASSLASQSPRQMPTEGLRGLRGGDLATRSVVALPRDGEAAIRRSLSQVTLRPRLEDAHGTRAQDQEHERQRRRQQHVEPIYLAIATSPPEPLETTTTTTMTRMMLMTSRSTTPTPTPTLTPAPTVEPFRASGRHLLLADEGRLEAA